MVKRDIFALIQKSLRMFPAVLLIGGRQVGKSTLLKQLLSEGLIADIATLDDLSVLEALSHDTEGFLNQRRLPAAFDEVQRFPNIMLPIKQMIDTQQKPGMFVLTGSANILSCRELKDSLAGRIDVITIEGLSTHEMHPHKPSSFLSTLFQAQRVADFYDIVTNIAPKEALVQSVLLGGYPSVRLKTDLDYAHRWFQSYEKTYIERDVRDMNRLIDIIAFNKAFKILATQTGNLVNFHTLANDVGIDQRTVKRYVEILEMTFQMTLIQPYFSNTRKSLVKSPKIYMNDPGHASYRCGWHDASQPIPGALLETWVFAELRKAACLETCIELFFYRTTKGQEIDFIVQKGSRLYAIECKGKTTLMSKDYSALTMFLEENVHALGVILYYGDKVLPLSDRLCAIPMHAFFQ